MKSKFWPLALVVIFIPLGITFAALPGTITYTSKTYSFSFDHLERYLNRIEAALQNQKKDCPSGNQSLCDQINSEVLKQSVREECTTNTEYKKAYTSVEVCTTEESKKFLDIIGGFKADFAKELNAPTDPEDSDTFSAYRNDGNEDTYFDNFSYSAIKAGDPLWVIYESYDDSVKYKVIQHGVYTEANGTAHPTIGYSESYFNPKVSFSIKNGVVVRIVDATEEVDKLDEETRALNPQLVRIASKTLSPYYKNTYGTVFYQINQGGSQEYRNFYCAMGIKHTICFTIPPNMGVDVVGSTAYNSMLAREKTIMDPIVKSFRFTNGTLAIGVVSKKEPVVPSPSPTPSAVSTPLVTPSPASSVPGEAAVAPVAPAPVAIVPVSYEVPKKTLLDRIFTFLDRIF